MFKNRKIQMLGMAVLLIAALTNFICKVSMKLHIRFIQFTRIQNSHWFYLRNNSAKSNEAGLAQYHGSEWESGAGIQNGLEIYHQSEWHGK